MPLTYPPGQCLGGGKAIKEKRKNMYAVIKSGGRQYKVAVGQTLEVNRLPVADGEQISIPEVLLIADADTSMIGAPFVENAVVLATAVRQARGEKLIVFRYKPKKRFRHKRGHRQELTILSIDDIVANGKSLITGEEPRSRTLPEVDAEADDTANDEIAAAPIPVEETPETEQRRVRRRRSSQAGEAESSTEE